MRRTITPASDRVIRHLNPLSAARALWRQRELIEQFTRREIEGRYRSSFLGLLWSFVTPLIMLAIYTFVFGVIFNARYMQGPNGNLVSYAMVLFAGLTTFGIFSECVTRAPMLIVGVPNYVKKVVFPLEVLPVSTLGAALFHAAISYGILIVALLLVSGIISWTMILLPVVLLPLLFLVLGLTWFLASLGVFVRDMSNVIGLVVQAMMFLTPIFYSAATLGEPAATLIQLNPLTPVVENVRGVLILGVMPDWGRWLGSSLAMGIVMVLGYAWFMRTRKAFADVL